MKNKFCLHNGKITRVLCEYPNKCPICHNGITPNNIMDYLNEQNRKVFLFFYCPSCGECFIGKYVYTNNRENIDNYTYYILEFEKSYPCIPNKITFDKCINDLSSSFCDIYNQANSSEIYQLNQIAGIGYRKALEFLIKDYCIYRHPDKAENIKSQSLSQVIDNFVDSTKIKNLSKASVWLGNDETHYIRKFEEKDITDLKRFITATVAFITYDLTSDEASDLLESK